MFLQRLYLVASGDCVGEPLLDVGFGLDVAVAGDVGVGVEGDDAFGGGDPAIGGAVFLVVDAWVGVVGGDDVAGGYDLFSWEVDDEVAAGVGGGPVVELELDAVDGERLFGFGDELVGEIRSGRSSGASGCDGVLLLLLVVRLRDDLEAGGECGEAVDVVAVAVGEDYGGDGLGRDLGDVGEELLRRLLWRL